MTRQASEPGVGGLDQSTATHPAEAFAPDGRLVFPDHMRHLPASIAHAASFVVAIRAKRIEDRRPAHERLVAGCESATYSLPSTRSGAIADKVAPNG